MLLLTDRKRHQSRLWSVHTSSVAVVWRDENDAMSEFMQRRHAQCCAIWFSTGCELWRWGEVGQGAFTPYRERTPLSTDMDVSQS